MFTRILVLGVWVAGAAGQWACTEMAEAAQEEKPKGGQFCGGFAAIPCPEGLVCVDDPNDSCDPNAGGADCGGICIDPKGEEKPKCDYGDPSRSYVSRDPAQCATIRFFCEPGRTPFFDDCGCGCELAPVP